MVFYQLKKKQEWAFGFIIIFLKYHPAVDFRVPVCMDPVGAWVCIISPGCAPLNRKTTAMMGQWKVAVSIYPIIHHSAVERTLTTDIMEDTELGWRRRCLEFKLMMSFILTSMWRNIFTGPNNRHKSTVL